MCMFRVRNLVTATTTTAAATATTTTTATTTAATAITTTTTATTTTTTPYLEQRILVRHAHVGLLLHIGRLAKDRGRRHRCEDLPRVLVAVANVQVGRLVEALGRRLAWLGVGPGPVLGLLLGLVLGLGSGLGFGFGLA